MVILRTYIKYSIDTIKMSMAITSTLSSTARQLKKHGIGEYVSSLLRGRITPLSRVQHRQIEEVSEAKNVEMLDVSAPAYVSRHPTVANYFTIDLTGLKAMTQELADLFGLTLPDSFKRQAHIRTGIGPLLSVEYADRGASRGVNSCCMSATRSSCKVSCSAV